MNNPKSFTCECGHTWWYGQHGGHNCIEYYRKTIARLEKAQANQLPLELTAENGAKYLLLGEFNETVTYDCSECHGDGCDECDNEGSYAQEIPVTWPTIKDIYAKIVKHYTGNEK